jgi:hypothetical protein
MGERMESSFPMKTPRLGAALIGLVALVLPLPVHAGGASQPAGKTQTPAWATVITVGHADGLAIDRRGNPSSTKWAYVPNSYNRTLIKVGTGGARLRSWTYAPPARYVSPVGVAVGGSGNVFVADGGTNRVVKFDPSGRQLAVFTGFAMPAGAAVDRAGNIYVAEETGLHITKLSPSGEVLARWPVPWVNGTGTAVPLSVAVDSQGNIYVGADCYRDECPLPHGIQYAVIKLNASGALVGSLLGNNPYVRIGPREQPFVTINSVDVDTKGTLYVGSSAIRSRTGVMDSGVLMYSAGLALQTISPLPGGRSPSGIAFDGRHALYVAYENRVLKRIP